MKKYRHILIVADPKNERDNNMALQRAVSIASIEGKSITKITVMLVIYDFSYEMTAILPQKERDEMRANVIEHQKAAIEKLITPFQSQANIDLHCIWHSKDDEAILEATETSAYDLVIKTSHLSPTLTNFIFTPTDWQLIRKCPIPLLIVKDEHWKQGGIVLGAVTCNQENAQQHDLNLAIIRETISMANLMNAKPHILNTYLPTPVNVAIELPDFDSQAFNEALRKSHWQQLVTYADQHHIPHTQIHLTQGSPEETLTKIAQQLEIHTLVIGSYARTGISAALVGNTAEHILDRVNCDLMVIKSAD